MFDDFLVVTAIKKFKKSRSHKYHKNFELQKCSQTKLVVALCCGNNGVKGGKGDGQRMFDDFLVVSAKQIQKMTGQKVGSAERIEVMT